MPQSKLFKSETCNALSDIFAQAAGVDPVKLSKGDGDAKYRFYVFVEEMPYGSLISLLADALEELGYKLEAK